MRTRPEPNIVVASSLGERATVERLLSEDPESVHWRDAHGRTPLHCAAWGGYREIMEALLRAGAQVDARDGLGRTPLAHLVAWCTRLDVVDLLLDHGADLDARDASDNTVLYLAASCIRRSGHCWGDHEGLVRHLLEQGAQIDLFSAAILDRPDAALPLIKADSERVTTQDRIMATDRLGWNVTDGATPLHRAADHGRLAMTELLLVHGADPRIPDRRGRPALYLAAHDAGTRKLAPSPDVAAALLEHGAQYDVFGAALLGQLDTLTRFLQTDRGLANVRDAGGSTPLHLAAWNAQRDAAELLLAHHAEIEARNLRGETPLALAQDSDLVDLLLAHGAVCDLPAAIRLNRMDRIEDCLQRDPGALTRMDRRGRTPLRLAAEPLLYGDQARIDMIERLLDLGAPLDIWTAATLNRPDEVLRAIAVDPTLLNAYDNTLTPLHCAAKMGHVKVIEALADAGAALDPVAQDLMTPLIWALWSGQREAAAALAAHGANVDALDNWSRKPWIAEALYKEAPGS